MIKLTMKSYNVISIEKQRKLHKFEYLTGDDILPSNQQQIIDQTKFTYSPLGKAFDKQIKTIEDQGKKQVNALNTLKSDNKLEIKDIFPESSFANDESRKKLIKLKKSKKILAEKNKFIKHLILENLIQ